MTDETTREQIVGLEAEIERLAYMAERCRKIMWFSKVAIVVGGLVLICLPLGVLRYDPAVLVGAMASVIGGIVALGSNRSTLERTVEASQQAEAQRAALIGRIGLRVVDGSFAGPHRARELD